MKKLITLLFCTAVLTSAFAQQNRRDGDDRNTNPYWNTNTNQKVYQNAHDRDDRSGVYDKRYNNNNTVYQNNGYNNYSQRDIQIQRISSQYDYRIQQVMNDWSLNRRQKEYAIRSLQAQKAQQINSISSQYNTNVYNNGRNRDNDYYQQNNRNNGYKQYNR